MRDGVEPFSIPREDAGPHLVALVGSDLAFERAGDGAEFDGEGAGAAVEDGVAVLVAGAVDAGGEEGAEEVRAGDVEVGVVGAVGFWGGDQRWVGEGAFRGAEVIGLTVPVEVHFAERTVGRCDEGLKDGGWSWARLLALRG